jgi:hypothetical protein
MRVSSKQRKPFGSNGTLIIGDVIVAKRPSGRPRAVRRIVY